MKKGILQIVVITFWCLFSIAMFAYPDHASFIFYTRGLGFTTDNMGLSNIQLEGGNGPVNESWSGNDEYWIDMPNVQVPQTSTSAENYFKNASGNVCHTGDHGGYYPHQLSAAFKADLIITPNKEQSFTFPVVIGIGWYWDCLHQYWHSYIRSKCIDKNGYLTDAEGDELYKISSSDDFHFDITSAQPPPKASL